MADTKISGLDATATVADTHEYACYEPGVGSVKSTAKQMRSYLVNDVLNYGAKGDGVTDDAASIQACIDATVAAGGGTVYLPAGNYAVKTVVAPNEGIHLKGAGIDVTTITWDGVAAPSWGAVVGTFHLGDDTLAYMTVSDMTIDCGGFSGDTRQISGCALRGQHHKVIERVRVTNPSGPTSELFAISNACILASADSYANETRFCQVDTPWGAYVSGFTMYHSVDLGRYALGCALRHNRGIGVNIGLTWWGTRNLVVESNVIAGGGMYGIMSDTRVSWNTTIRNNYFDVTHYGIVLGGGAATHFDGYDIYDNLINSDGVGVRVSAYVTNSAIHHNTFKGDGSGKAFELAGAGNANIQWYANDIEAGLTVDAVPTEVAFAALPAAPVVGQLANISDSNTAVWGATAAAGGGENVMVRWNGAVWTVVGK